MRQRIMDDHFEALPFWQEIGLRCFTCVHVDAHLDVQDAGLPEALLQEMLESPPFEDYRGNPQLPWGGLHCGNYLYPALRAGWIDHLVWVLPPHLVADGSSLIEWLRGQLPQWVDLPLHEYANLQAHGAWRVDGELVGRRFTACSAQAMPELKGPVALDIDVDYFVTLEDQLWQSPAQLRGYLGDLHPVALTVACSVEGGYTPDHWAQQLASQCLESFGGQAVDWQPPVSQCLDRASRCLHRQTYQEGLQWLQQADSEDPVRAYLEAMLQLKLNQLEPALQALEQLAGQPILFPRERAQVAYMAAGVELLRGRPRQAQKQMEQALALAPERSDFLSRYAQSFRKQGQYRQATRQFRRALRGCLGRLSGLEVQLELARTYAEMGQQGLSMATHRELQTCDVTGLYAMESLLEEQG